MPCARRPDTPFVLLSNRVVYTDAWCAGADTLLCPSLAHDLSIHSTQVLPFEQVYLDSLPSTEMYEKSFMHRDFVTLVVSGTHCSH